MSYVHTVKAVLQSIDSNMLINFLFEGHSTMYIATLGLAISEDAK